jgi:hypothetical protein
MRKDRAGGRNRIIQDRHGSNRLENHNAKGGGLLVGSLVAYMAVRALRAFGEIMMIPVADYTGGKDD